MSPWIYAAILSTSHSFLVDNYECGKSLGTLEHLRSDRAEVPRDRREAQRRRLCQELPLRRTPGHRRAPLLPRPIEGRLAHHPRDGADRRLALPGAPRARATSLRSSPSRGDRRERPPPLQRRDHRRVGDGRVGPLRRHAVPPRCPRGFLAHFRLAGETVTSTAEDGGIETARTPRGRGRIRPGVRASSRSLPPSRRRSGRPRSPTAWARRAGAPSRSRARRRRRSSSQAAASRARRRRR